eukprot:9855884-Alexandrium_andersonii.AAC.1
MCIRDRASSGGFGVISRAEADGDDEAGRRARRRRFSTGVRGGGAPPPGRHGARNNLRSTNPKSGNP